MKSKILIGVTLAVVMMLAVPLGLMASSIMRGESPRQLAEKEPAEDTAADSGGEEEARQLDAVKPVVPSTTGPMPPPPVTAAAEPAEPAEQEPAAEPAAAPAPASGKKRTSVQKPKAAAETQTPKAALPKAVLSPNEAPCMVDGLDGYAYDYGS